MRPQWSLPPISFVSYFSVSLSCPKMILIFLEFSDLAIVFKMPIQTSFFSILFSTIFIIYFMSAVLVISSVKFLKALGCVSISNYTYLGILWSAIIGFDRLRISMARLSLIDLTWILRRISQLSIALVFN